MKVIGENSNNKNILLENVLSIEINSEYSVPADDFSVKIVGRVPHLQKIYLEDDFGNIIFKGIVDEVVTKQNSGGAESVIYARNYTALALDNECEPCEYISPSIDIIYKKHLERFGISFGKHDYVPCRQGVMKIGRGNSHYYAVKKFCDMFLCTVPRISWMGDFRTDYRNKNEISVDNVYQITYRRKRCSQISKIYVYSGQDVITVKNPAAENDNIIRERRVNLSDSRTGTLSDIDDIIQKSMNSNYTAEVKCIGFFGDVLGSRIFVNDDSLKGVIIKSKFTMKNNLMFTDFTVNMED